MKVHNQKGFSLIELMVTIAIMAILSVIAIPSYKSFQARARQKEGLNLMTTYYTAAHATFAEFDLFPGNFVATAFAPVGALNYRIQAADGTDIPGALNDNACISSQNTLNCNCGGACPTFKTWSEAPLGVIGSSYGPQTVIAACPPLANLGVTDTTFSIRVAAVINTSAATLDRWGIDHNKQIVQCSDGSK